MPKKSNKKTLDLTQSEKAIKEKEMDEKFAQIQEELKRAEQGDPEEVCDEEPEQQEEPEPEYEEEEEEVVVRKPLPKKAVKSVAPPPMKKYNNFIPRKPAATSAPRKKLDSMVQQTSLELLKQDFHKQMRQRLMSELFDF
jgi:hypothetical protein